MRRPVVGYAADFTSGHLIRRHRHSAGQLIFASSGVMTVTTVAGRWVVPPERAVWVPPNVTHAIRMTGAVHMRTLYLDGRAVPALPDTCSVVQVTGLLRELILRVVGFTQPYPRDGHAARIVAVLFDEMAAARTAPLHLPLPRDPRLLAITERLSADPADKRELSAWARSAGASSRTLARLFRRETGLGFAQWRQQARLLRALERLAAGDPVTAIALDLGYDSPSAFITMFRSRLGATPGRYFGRPEAALASPSADIAATKPRKPAPRASAAKRRRTR
ncbi:MAG: helix-turn-helix transcriptional regulator [Candidatus Binatia bacterium]